MTTIPVDPTPANLQMYLGTIAAVLREELGRPPDFENPDDSVGAVLLNMALFGRTKDDMVAYLREQPEWHDKHDPKPQPVVAGPELHGRLRVVGPRLFDAAGPWRWKMVTAFDAQRLMIRNETAQLSSYAEWTKSVGGNGWRVFLNWVVSGLDFRQVPTYFDGLRRLCDFTAAQRLRLVPIDAPTWSYSRYGPAHPSVPMPVVLDPRDADETSRMHAMVGPTQALAVNYNAALSGREDWTAQPTSGWRIVRQDGPVVLCERV